MSTRISKKMDNTDNNKKIYKDVPTASTFGTEGSSFLIEEISMLQLGDSFFPTGMYTTSSGLETLFYDKKIRTKEEILEFITVCLKYQIGPADCAALSNAYEFAKEGNLSKIIEVDQILFSMKLIKDIRNASIRSGTQLLSCLLSFVKDNNLISSYYSSIKNKAANGVYPVALAVASNSLGIKKERACLILLYGFIVSIVGAGLRLGILQHLEAQQIIHELKPIITVVINDNMNRNYSHLWQFSPGIDLVQMKHEKMDSKMFIT
ncbi:MAG TPA: urease accessory UreF family protein [Nitrososphaeraceae archaeon]|nr:urease accessory UreF family protein [Nitrososphaeraceae archaeon]